MIEKITYVQEINGKRRIHAGRWELKMTPCDKMENGLVDCNNEYIAHCYVRGNTYQNLGRIKFGEKIEFKSEYLLKQLGKRMVKELIMVLQDSNEIFSQMVHSIEKIYENDFEIEWKQISKTITF